MGFGALEASCRCRDEEIWPYGDGLQSCRRGGMELWRCAAGVWTCRCRGIFDSGGVLLEEFVSRALEMRCGRVDV